MQSVGEGVTQSSQEMRSLQDVGLPGQKQGRVGFDQDHRQVVSIVLVLVGLLVVQFINDSGNGVFGLRQVPGQSDFQPVGIVLPTVSFHGLDD